MLKPKSKLSVSALDEADELPAYVTIDQVAAICQEVATAKLTDVVSYQPTLPQVFFFTLVRAAKEIKKKQQAAKNAPVAWPPSTDALLFLAPAAVRKIAGTVANHLTRWGAIVESLQQRAAQEWELLRIQMEGAIKRFGCPQAIKDAALSDALLKVFQVLSAMPTAQRLQTTEDILEFLLEQQANLTGIYDFHSPFYAYTHLIARNALFYEMRHARREPIYPVAWDELSVEPATEDHYEFEVQEEVRVAEEKARAEEAQRLQLRLDLARLFDLIMVEMRPQKKRRLVVWHTLAARSQYWLALALTELPPPVPLAPTPQASDAAMAKALTMTENTVRVHRKQAKSQVEGLDAACGELLETLMDLDQSNDLRWWPKN